MKDIIIITAHCPDIKKKNQLYEFVQSLQKFRDQFDILISSHTHIPLEITEAVDFTIFDKENPLITDNRYLSSSWCKVNENFTVWSTLVGKGTYILAIFRLISLGVGLAKTMNYKKIHIFEYDSYIEDISCISDNSKLLESYDSIYYTPSGDKNDFLLGFSFSFRTDKTIKMLGGENYDEEFCLNSLFRFGNQAPEIVLRNYFQETNFICKKFDEINKNGNKLGQSGNVYQPNYCIPVYDSTQKMFKFLANNLKFKEGKECSIIINKEKYHNFGVIKHMHWYLIDLCSYDELNYLDIILDGKLEYSLNFSPEFKEHFIKKNYIDYSKAGGYG